MSPRLLSGRVSAIIAPNEQHYFWTGQSQERFPQARTFAEPALRKKVKDPTNTAQLAIEPPGFYANEIDQTLCLGNPFFQEAVFSQGETHRDFHRLDHQSQH